MPITLVPERHAALETFKVPDVPEEFFRLPYPEVGPPDPVPVLAPREGSLVARRGLIPSDGVPSITMAVSSWSPMC